METIAKPTSITGRFTLEQLEHLAGTLLWPRSVPETVVPRDQQELYRLVEMAREYISTSPGGTAHAVDILEGQILNVC